MLECFGVSEIGAIDITMRNATNATATSERPGDTVLASVTSILYPSALCCQSTLGTAEITHWIDAAIHADTLTPLFALDRDAELLIRGAATLLDLGANPFHTGDVSSDRKIPEWHRQLHSASHCRATRCGSIRHLIATNSKAHDRYSISLRTF